MYFGYLEKVCSTQQTRLHVPNRKTKYEMCLFLPFKCLYLFQVQVIYVWLIKQSFKTMAGSKCKEIFFHLKVGIHNGSAKSCYSKALSSFQIQIRFFLSMRPTKDFSGMQNSSDICRNWRSCEIFASYVNWSRR